MAVDWMDLLSTGLQIYQQGSAADWEGNWYSPGPVGQPWGQPSPGYYPGAVLPIQYNPNVGLAQQGSGDVQSYAGQIVDRLQGQSGRCITPYRSPGTMRNPSVVRVPNPSPAGQRGEKTDYYFKATVGESELKKIAKTKLRSSLTTRRCGCRKR
jgi:hypothetical protein